MPPGWPRDLPPAGSTAFDAKVVGWLLDRGPAELRGSDLRLVPIALARVVAQCVDAQVDALREAYRTVRADLGSSLHPEELALVQRALEAQGAILLATAREVHLVEAAVRRAHGRLD